jgi:hypothetical protein
MSAINHGTEVPTDSRREVLMGYQYALHQHKKRLREEKSELRRSRENNSASTRSYQEEQSEMLGSSEERHCEPKHSRRRIAQPRKEDRARSISAPLSEEEDFIQETPEAALVVAQAYQLTTRPEAGDPREQMHQAAIKSLGLVADELKQKSSGKKSTYQEYTGRRSRRSKSPPSQRNNLPSKTNNKAQREDARNIIAQARVNKARYAWDEETTRMKRRKWGHYALPEGFVERGYPKDSSYHTTSKNMMGLKNPDYGYQNTFKQYKYLEDQEQQQCKACSYTSPEQHGLG